MNYELVTRLALLHRDELLRAAAVRRLLVHAGRHASSPRARLAAGVRTLGHVALTLSEAIDERGGYARHAALARPETEGERCGAVL